MPPPPLRRRAPAKLNLGLHVLRRRPDGYHAVETVLVGIEWADELAYRSSERFALSCSDSALPTDERNLVVRAALALAEWAGTPPRGALHLEKRVPQGAGLGGGSSDAAHALRLLAEAWGLAPPPEDLHALAAGLGSDVPFFLHDVPMLATGRGEGLDPVGGGYRLPFPLAVVMPPAQVATAEAYGLVTPRDHPRPDLRAVVASNDPERWRKELVNDFEAPVLARYPSIASAKARLASAGAAYAAMTGSGAAVFGVFECEDDARNAAEAAEAEGLRAWWGYASEPSSSGGGGKSSAGM
jgi:4-diphosphocytidyl-2-C-methyl-D-erythritol kinase